MGEAINNLTKPLKGLFTLYFMKTVIKAVNESLLNNVNPPDNVLLPSCIKNDESRMKDSYKVIIYLTR